MATKKKSPKKKTARKAKSSVQKTTKPKKAAPKAKKARAAKARREPVLLWRRALPGETKLGVVDDYYGHVGVIALKLETPLSVGQKIHVRGHTTDFTETVGSIQIEHQSVQDAKPGDPIGIKVGVKCRGGDWVYLAP